MKEIGSAVDDVWAQLGSFGRYTVINYALLLVPCYLYGMYGSVYNFEAMDINYRYVTYRNNMWIKLIQHV